MTLLGLRPDLVDKAEFFKALGDVNRLRILVLLRDAPRCVTDLVGALETPQATVSHHLKILRRAGLVVAEKQGRENYYRLTLLAEARHGIF
ncbi:MAG: winged helix-turn-helix transcriptional regulator [Candidatus Sericytochromatia bacterium]|nr:winged helix-turn-helix transcriptional regulator [Candidatus Tanganyikabacteria bacterium]